MPSKAELSDLLGRHAQEHLLAFWDELGGPQRVELAADIAAVDLRQFDRVLASFRAEAAGEGVVLELDPGVPRAFPVEPGHENAGLYERAAKVGGELIGAGRVAAMVVAGGQATRLGLDAPKGTFPIGPVSGKSLFQLFAESIFATNRRWGCRIPWYVMTSSANHADTERFFREGAYFGLSPSDVRFFEQGMFPIADRDGKILLDQKHRVAMAPNGHGGSLTALATSGMLDDMRERGIEHVSYFQVDNPLVRPVDPLFIGLHALERSQASSLTVRKVSDDEKVGIFVTVDGRLKVMEYTSLPKGLAARRTVGGERMYDFANIAVHLFELTFLETLVTEEAANRLPWHRAIKKVPHVDLKTGERIEPSKPNAIKFEMFVFDAVPRADRTMILEADRGEVFSPVKNAEGVDSVASARRDMVARAARWLESCGKTVPRKSDGPVDSLVEISPLAALDATELAERDLSALDIPAGGRVHIAE